MQLFSVEGNGQRLDGGAMFGNCPRALWTRWCEPDAANQIPLACRTLLVREDSGRNVLFEAGGGAFFEPAMRERYGVDDGEHVLLRSLAARGVAPEDVDLVVLSHLHFDHAGGLLAPWREGHGLELVFTNASFVVSEAAWQRNLHPHARDRASFIPELPALLEATGRVEWVTGAESSLLGDGYRFEFSQGHTPGLMLTRIEADDPGPITFASDLVPGVPWIHPPITMGYDRFPEQLVDEKVALLERVAAEDEWLLLVHDPEVAACRIERDARGRFGPSEARRVVG